MDRPSSGQILQQGPRLQRLQLSAKDHGMFDTRVDDEGNANSNRTTPISTNQSHRRPTFAA